VKIIAFGDAALMDGFALLGIQLQQDQSAAAIEATLQKLARNRERALVFMQQDLMSDAIPMLAQLRRQGGSILICELPSLSAADHYRPAVEKLISRVLGPALTEPGSGH
jgi:vacuolar-type H+-ATPase subunit F/Vma7